jgi:hypothetical protein
MLRRASDCGVAFIARQGLAVHDNRHSLGSEANVSTLPEIIASLIAGAAEDTTNARQ